ncbi:MAG TPA: DNA mismatch repair protein MutS [Anaeromyxobacter sp.]|nr:DNA mismatch repair protein MutS [Anaeromyxobacter sp.]
MRARREAIARHDRADRRIASGRLAVFAAALAVAWAAFVAHRTSAWWLLAPAAAFVALATVHDRVLSARDRARRAVAFYERALERIAGRFAGTGTPGDAFGDPTHPYAVDLDLFGRGSLFELLCAARTRPGEERLASWLLAPAQRDDLLARQRAVAALAPRLDLREDLAVLGDDVRAAVDARELAAWGEEGALLEPWLLPASLALAGAAIAAAVAWGLGGGPIPLLAVLLAEWGFARTLREPIARALGGVERPAAELRVLALLLARLEREPLDDERLRRLQAALAGRGAPSSARIAALVSTVARLEWGRNQLFAPVAFALSWGPLHAALVERWRRAAGREIRGWLDAVAELEALGSLAGYAYEHPGDPFPELADGGPERLALVEGEALRHPLLADAVPNDVRLGGAGPRVLLVSGSNMSGKSTYLRTVGVNAVLALAGAPVRAARLRLSPVRVGATLRIQDSLQAGRSRFYAEITRLKELADLAAGEVPLLFLLDEILHGTNSHDRRIGAEAVIRGLVASGAIGLVTTHDLALTALAGGTAAGMLANAHFEDQVRDGEIAFDYRLKPGVVTHSNALALMRAVGLDV